MQTQEREYSGHSREKLEDLEFVDDLALLSHRLQDMQDKLTALSDIAKKVGLKISKEKTKLMRTNNERDANQQRGF